MGTVDRPGTATRFWRVIDYRCNTCISVATEPHNPSYHHEENNMVALCPSGKKTIHVIQKTGTLTHSHWCLKDIKINPLFTLETVKSYWRSIHKDTFSKLQVCTSVDIWHWETPHLHSNWHARLQLFANVGHCEPSCYLRLLPKRESVITKKALKAEYPTLWYCSIFVE